MCIKVNIGQYWSLLRIKWLIIQSKHKDNVVVSYSIQKVKCQIREQDMREASVIDHCEIHSHSSVLTEGRMT